jgi:hypothetical protein
MREVDVDTSSNLQSGSGEEVNTSNFWLLDVGSICCVS